MKQIQYERLIQYILENQDRFYRMAYSYTRYREDALDAVQSAVCKSLEAHKNIKNADAIKTWFYRILINECLAILKKRNKVVLTADSVEQGEMYYEKRYEQGGDIEQELSTIMELNLNTVKTKLYRGLKQLKENIQETEL